MLPLERSEIALSLLNFACFGCKNTPRSSRSLNAAAAACQRGSFDVAIKLSETAAKREGNGRTGNADIEDTGKSWR